MVTPDGMRSQRSAPRLAIEVEVYIEPDGSVTFADLEAGMIPVARALNPDDPATGSVPADQKPALLCGGDDAC